MGASYDEVVADYLVTYYNYYGIQPGTEKAANADYAMFVQYLGDIYQVTTNWTTQRYEWWNLLQRIGDGGNVADEVATYIKNVNL